METILTQEAALAWLAGLERITCGYPDAPRCWCPEGDCPCHSLSFAEVHGKVFVLDLREPCSCAIWRPGLAYPCDVCRRLGTFYHGQDCTNCQGRNWIPKQGRDALHQAMRQDGWYYNIFQTNTRRVIFWRWGEARPPVLTEISGSDSDDHMAAYKALLAVGYK